MSKSLGLMPILMSLSWVCLLVCVGCIFLVANKFVQLKNANEEIATVRIELARISKVVPPAEQDDGIVSQSLVLGGFRIVALDHKDEPDSFRIDFPSSSPPDASAATDTPSAVTPKPRANVDMIILQDEHGTWGVRWSETINETATQESAAPLTSASKQ